MIKREAWKGADLCPTAERQVDVRIGGLGGLDLGL